MIHLKIWYKNIDKAYISMDKIKITNLGDGVLTYRWKNNPMGDYQGYISCLLRDDCDVDSLKDKCFSNTESIVFC